MLLLEHPLPYRWLELFEFLLVAQIGLSPAMRPVEKLCALCALESDLGAGKSQEQLQLIHRAHNQEVWPTDNRLREVPQLQEVVMKLQAIARMKSLRVAHMQHDVDPREVGDARKHRLHQFLVFHLQPLQHEKQPQLGQPRQNVQQYGFAIQDLHHLGITITPYQSHQSPQRHRGESMLQLYLQIEPLVRHHVDLGLVLGIPGRSSERHYRRYLLLLPRDDYGHTNHVTSAQLVRYLVYRRLQLATLLVHLLAVHNHRESTRSTQ